MNTEVNREELSNEPMAPAKPVVSPIKALLASWKVLGTCSLSPAGFAGHRQDIRGPLMSHMSHTSRSPDESGPCDEQQAAPRRGTPR